jgi:Flp pilus assembly pilin Flp
MPAGCRAEERSGMFATTLRRIESEEKGQGTIEYVLVMLAVAAVAVVLIAWAKSGSGKAALEGLFTNVISWVSAAAAKFR